MTCLKRNINISFTSNSSEIIKIEGRYEKTTLFLPILFLAHLVSLSSISGWSCPTLPSPISKPREEEASAGEEEEAKERRKNPK